MPHEVDVQPGTVSCHPQLFQGGARAGEVTARDQGDDPFDLPRLEGHAIFPGPLDGGPGITRGSLASRQSDRGGITGQASVLKRQEHDVVLAFLIVAELSEGLMERARIQINHERP